MPQDVAAAVRWLKDSIPERGGDAERIFLVGHSSGCQLAALVAHLRFLFSWPNLSASCPLFSRRVLGSFASSGSGDESPTSAFCRAAAMSQRRRAFKIPPTWSLTWSLSL